MPLQPPISLLKANASYKPASSLLGRKSHGFALVISLSLMVFIVLLLLSLAALVRMETVQVSTIRKTSEARQMALFAAMQALGELQKNVGPDQRVTARAEILDSTPDTETIDGLNEPYWTGVWITDPDDTSNTTGGEPYQNPTPIKNGLGYPGGALSWLVSTPGANPLNNTRNADDVALLQVDPSDPSDPRNIYLPLENLKDADGNLRGQFAWWVADDGVKASLAMDSPWARSGLPEDTALMQVAATRMAPEFIQDNDPLQDLSVLTGLGAIDGPDSYTEQLEHAGSLPQLHLLLKESGLNDADSEELLANHYHDLTSLSLGVLADTREGGLKRNLSAAFSNPSDFATLKSEHGELIFGHRNQSQPYDPIASDVDRGDSSSQTDRRDPGGPPWEQLRSFYQTRSNAVTVQAETNNQMGVYPIITMIQVHTHMMLLELPSSTATDPQYTIRLMIFPAIVLWNPYNATLPQTDYSLFLTTSANKLKYNWTPEIDWIDSTGNSHSWKAETSGGSKIVFEGGDEHGNDTGAFRFNISSAFAPGEAKLFVPGQVEPQNWASSNGSTLTEAATVGFTSGGYFYSDLSETFRPAGAGAIPDLTQSFTLRLSRNLYSATNTWSLGNMTILMGLNPGNNGMDTMIQNGLLQSVGGFNQGALSNASTGTDIYPSWTVNPASIQSTSASLTAWDNLPLASLGGDEYFPIVGFTQHIRWNQNLNPVTYSGNLTPIVSTLASYNPRAARSERTPIEHAQQTGRDSRYNSLYLNWSGNRSDNMGSSRLAEAGSAAPDWGTFYQSLNYTPPAVGYTDDPNLSLITQNTLFDLPQGSEYFQSIGSLTHASLAPPMPRTDSPTNYFLALASGASDWNVNSSYPAFAIGNSLAPLGVPLDDRSRHSYVTGSNLPTDPASSLYDWSYLLNDYLWDRYFFAEYDSTNSEMLNPRLTPISGASQVDMSSYDKAAEVLMVKGSFNVNSTSVDAWRALLAGTVGTTVNSSFFTDRAPYLKNQSPLLGDADQANEQDAVTYAGYRTLSENEIESLAQEIVKQVKKRGPFTSMSHFVNRVIDDPSFISTRENANLTLTSSNRERAIGALQAALEASTVNDRYEQSSNVIEYSDLGHFNQFNRYTGMGSLSYGQPGYLTQADLLSRLGAALSPRSDTFTIRAYGQSMNPLSQQPESIARCEMVVQREPEELSTGTQNRRFTIVSFRWLDDSEI